jgi:hypothetical protein
MYVYFLAGADDFINADADVAGTQTSPIFEHLRGASPL